MSAKKSGPEKPKPTKKQLRAVVKRLRTEVASGDERVTALERRVARVEKAAARSKQRIKLLEPDPEPATPAELADLASWPVSRLRREARARQVAGYSRMSKAELLTALA